MKEDQNMNKKNSYCRIVCASRARKLNTAQKLKICSMLEVIERFQ